MLEVRGLKKAYGSFVAVEDATFTVTRGQSFGLLGPNGAGKTTTISMIVGNLAPDAGSVGLGGQAISPTNPEARRQIGYVPQELALYDEIDAWENLRFFASLYGLFGAEAKRRSAEVLEIVGLTDRATTRVGAYSGGMKRRLNIAAALLHRPELLVLDEPTVGVDPQSRNAIFETLQRLQGEGATLLYTTHYMEEVERLCQRIAVMDHGRVIACDTLSGLHRLLPARNRVTFELEDDAWPFGDSLPGSQSVARVGSTVDVEVGDLNADLPCLLAALGGAGVRYRSLRSHQASLEEVFLHLTGRSLRD